METSRKVWGGVTSLCERPRASDRIELKGGEEGEQTRTRGFRHLNSTGVICTGLAFLGLLAPPA